MAWEPTRLSFAIGIATIAVVGSLLAVPAGAAQTPSSDAEPSVAVEPPAPDGDCLLVHPIYRGMVNEVNKVLAVTYCAADTTLGDAADVDGIYLPDDRDPTSPENCYPYAIQSVEDVESETTCVVTTLLGGEVECSVQADGLRGAFDGVNRGLGLTYCLAEEPTGAEIDGPYLPEDRDPTNPENGCTSTPIDDPTDPVVCSMEALTVDDVRVGPPIGT